MTLEGVVIDAGGGMVTILVDRDTAEYPEVGQRVDVLSSPDALGWEVVNPRPA